MPAYAGRTAAGALYGNVQPEGEPSLARVIVL